MISEGRDGERRVRADGTRHHRAVDYVETRLTEGLPVRVNDSLIRGLCHRAAAERVGGEHLMKVPGVGGIVHVFGVQRPGDRLHRPPDPVVIFLRALEVPIAFETTVLEKQPCVRDVPPHGEYGHGALRGIGRADQIRYLCAEVCIVAQPQTVLDDDLEEMKGAAKEAREARYFCQPAHEVRVAAILDVEAAALWALLVQRVAETDRTGDDRPEAWVEAARHVLTVLFFYALDDEGQQVAVDAVARTKSLAQTRQSRAVFHQEEGGAERPCGQDQTLARDPSLFQGGRVRLLALALEVVLDVVDGVSSPIEGLESLYLAERSDVCRARLMNRRRDVGVIERILASEIAANVTLAAEAAGGTRHLAAQLDRMVVLALLFDRRAHYRRVVGASSSGWPTGLLLKLTARLSGIHSRPGFLSGLSLSAASFMASIFGVWSYG